MKLLVVTYGLNTVGGVQSWQHLFAHEFIKRGHSVTLYETYDYSKTHSDKAFIREWDSRIRIVSKNGPVVQRGVNPRTCLTAISVYFDFLEKIKFSRFVKNERFDSILFVDPNFTFFLPRSIIRTFNCFVQFHSSFVRFKSTSKLRYLLTKKRAKYYNKFIFLSRGDMKQAIDDGFDSDKVGYMYNFINESRFLNIQKSDFAYNKQILIVANLDNPDKQVDHVLKAFAIIDFDIRMGWMIKIVGEGEYKSKLIQLSIDLDIDSQVIFTGKKSNPTLDFFESNFYVLSSSFEGAPLTLLECVFSNLPAISYNCSPFVKEIIRDGYNGKIIYENDWKPLAVAMQNFMQDSTLVERMSLRLNEVQPFFSLENIIGRWESLFEREDTYKFN